MQFTEISTKTIRSGTNVNGSATALPAYRVVGHSTSSVYGDPVDLLSVTGASKLAGVTSHEIAVGETGDLHTEGVVPIESDGTGAIAAGDDLTVNVTAGATDGRVKKAAPGSGVNAFLVGKARTAAAATAGLKVMVELNFSVMQGQ